jgi:hypothetical protein
LSPSAKSVRGSMNTVKCIDRCGVCFLVTHPTGTILPSGAMSLRSQGAVISASKRRHQAQRFGWPSVFDVVCVSESSENWKQISEWPRLVKIGNVNRN